MFTKFNQVGDEKLNEKSEDINQTKEQKMNNQISKGKWKEFKGKIREQWGDLSDDELEKTKGNMDQIAGKVQQKYVEVHLDEPSLVISIIYEVAEQLTNNVRIK